MHMGGKVARAALMAALAAGWGCSGTEEPAPGPAQTEQAVTSATGLMPPTVTTWERERSGSLDEAFVALATDPAGNLIAARTYVDPGTGNTVHFVEKDDPTGSGTQWVFGYRSNDSWTNDAVVVTPAGDVYASARCTSASCGQGVTAITRISGATGQNQWSIDYQPPVEGFATDSTGALITTAQSNDGQTLQKLRPDSTYAWIRTFSQQTSGSLVPGTVGVAPDDGLVFSAVITGQYNLDGHVLTGGSSGSTFLIKVSSSNAYVWARIIPGPPVDLSSIQFSKSGTVVALVHSPSAGGSWAGTTLTQSSFSVLVAETTGVPRFARGIGNDMWPTTMAVDPSGQVAVSATYYGTLHLTELDLANELLWTRVIQLHNADGTPLQNPEFSQLAVGGMAVQPDHSIVFGGAFSGGALITNFAQGIDAYLMAIANAQVPVAFDAFNRSGALGSAWRVAHGAWSTNGSRAVGSQPQSYAVSTTTAPADVAVSASVSAVSGDYLGVIARANGTSPDMNHYAAEIGPDGHVMLSRRNNWNYTTLTTSTAPAVSPGDHRLVLSVSGSNPVNLAVALDGVTVVTYSDSSSSRLTSGPCGMFDYAGSAVGLDDFWIAPLEVATSSSGGTGSGGGTTTTLFSDSFSRSGALGSNWFIKDGTWSVNGTAARGTGENVAYAFWTGRPAANSTTAITLATPLAPTYVGITARAVPADPERDHYAAYVAPDGLIHVARSNAWSYTYLADGPAFPSGSHVLSLTTTGSGPVTLSVKVDGTEVIHFVDSDPAALKAAGQSGMFDYEGAGQPIDAFTVAEP